MFSLQVSVNLPLVSTKPYPLLPVAVTYGIGILLLFFGTPTFHVTVVFEVLGAMEQII